MLNFPLNPAVNDTYASGDRTWKFNGIGWALVATPAYGTTSNVAEGTNLYYTTARARSAFSATGSLSYNQSTGEFSYTAPTALSAFTNDTNFITAAASITGNAATATKLATSRNIAGIAFDGSTSISIPFANLSSKPTTLSGFGITDAVSSSLLGAVNGVATLDSSGTVPASQLPSYVDDVLEFATLAAFPATGEQGKIYVALNTNKTYRWGGSTYIVITASPGSTDEVAEGSTNLYFTNARVRAAISATQNLSYNSTTGVFTGPDLSGYLTSATAATTYQAKSNDLTAIAGLAGTSGLLKKTAAGTWSLDTSSYLTGITSAQVTTALGFTPYDSTNPSSFINQAGARSAISVSGSLAYNSATGVISYTAPSALSAFTNDTGFLTSTTAANTYLPLAGGNLTGNLGLAGSPASWASNGTLDLSNNLAISGYVSGVVWNVYYNSGWKYKSNGLGTAYLFGSDEGGHHSWYTVANNTGGSGTAATLNRVMRMTSAGNLLINTSTDDGVNKLQVNGGFLAKSLRETKVTMSANDIDLSAGNAFTKTITAATTLTVSNVPTTGTFIAFILDLTNGGAFTVTWWSGIKWESGTVPTLTASGRDSLGFYTYDGGTTWTGLIKKDVK